MCVPSLRVSCMPALIEQAAEVKTNKQTCSQMDPGTLEFLPITAPFWSPVAWIAANAIHRKNAKKKRTIRLQTTQRHGVHWDTEYTVLKAIKCRRSRWSTDSMPKTCDKGDFQLFNHPSKPNLSQILLSLSSGSRHPPA